MAKKVLTGQTSSGTSSSSYSKATTTTSNKSKTYTKSKVPKKIKNALTQAEKPYESQYQSQIDNTLNTINNRKFSYDMNKDALYQQYAKQYKALGNQAMQESQANASTLTGGYGSSYVQTAGQQAYNSYLQQLNDIVPDLYAQSRTNYDTETNELYNKLDTYNNMDSEAYSRWSNNRDYMRNVYNSEWDHNAVQNTTETNKTIQTEKNNSSSSSTNSTYTPKASATRPTVTSNDYKYYQNTKDFLTNNGFSGAAENLLGFSDFVKESKKNNSDYTYTKKDYSKYLQNYIKEALDSVYGK